MGNIFDELTWSNITPSHEVYSLLRGESSDKCVQLVSAASGTGKSRLFNRLSKEFSKVKHTWVASINAANIHPEDSIIQALGGSDFRINLSFYDAIVILLKQRQSFLQKTILLIDNADQLSLDILKQLILIFNKKHSVKGEFDFRIILFSDDVKKSHWADISKSITTTYYIQSMTLDQVTKLLVHVYDYLGFEPKKKLSITEVAQLHRDSDGNLGKFLEKVAVILAPEIELHNTANLKQEILHEEQNTNFVNSLYFKEVDAVQVKSKWMSDSAKLTQPNYINHPTADAKYVLEDANAETSKWRIWSFIHNKLGTWGIVFLCVISMLGIILQFSLLPDKYAKLWRATNLDAHISLLDNSNLNQGAITLMKQLDVFIANALQNSNVSLSSNLANKGNLNIGKIQLISKPNPPNQLDKKQVKIKPKSLKYIIQLSKGRSTQYVKATLFNIPVPDDVKLAKINIKGRIQYVTYLGPYNTAEQAAQELKKLSKQLKPLRPMIQTSQNLINI